MKTMRYMGNVLTPVHIGTGETIDPLDYVVRDGKLVRFSLPAVIADLKADDRQRLEGMLEPGELGSLHNFFRNHVDPQRHAVAVVDAAPEVVQEFEEKCTNPNNQLKVHPMIRNLHTRKAYIPGSSIKGALRTAVVSRIVNAEPERGRFERELATLSGRGRKDREIARTLQEITLGYEQRRMERDPFRLLKVADAELPDGVTRVDKVHNYKPGRLQDMPIDMWERVRSKAEGETVAFEVGMQFDEAVLAHKQASQNVGRRLSWEEIVDASNDFYFRRLIEEVDRFFPAGKADLTRPVVYRTLARRGPDGTLKMSKPQAPDVLLRIGRFSHFESLSVDGFRKGWNLRAKREMEKGVTRNLVFAQVPVKMKDGRAVQKQVSLPFGWVLLSPAA